MSLTGNAHLTVNGDESIGRFGTGTFSQSALNHLVTGNLTVGPGGHFTLDTGGALAVGMTHTIDPGGTFDQLDGDVNATSLSDSGTYNLTGGTLRGAAQNVQSGGILNWTGGQIGDASHGTTAVASGGSLVISGSGNRPLLNREFTNDGVVKWNGTTDILAQQGTTVQNGTLNAGTGVLEIYNDQSFHYDGTGTGVTNYGTIWKKAGAGVTQFNSSLTSTGTIQVDTGTVRVNGRFIASGTIDGSGTTEAGAGSGAFTIADGTGTPAILSKNGAGSLVINAAQDHPAGSKLQVNAGTAVFNTDAGSSSGRNLSVQVADAAHVSFNSTQHVAQLDISGTANLASGRRMISANELRLNSTSTLGTLDVSDGAMTIHGGSSIGDITSWLASGYASRTWTGIGINSSAAAANPADRSVGTGPADNLLGIPSGGTSTWLGETVEADSILLRYTLPGDANLDGVVDFSDQTRLAQHYNYVGGMHWYEGDFNYDGNVDFSDLAILSQHYNTSLPPTGAAPVFSAVAVPEPVSSLVLLPVGAVALCRRRRRRN
jgi:hypothetical protein